MGRTFKKKFFHLLFSRLLATGLFLLLTAWMGSGAALGSSGATGAGPAAWEQFQKDSINSGQTTSPAPVAELTVGWRRQVQVDNPQAPMAGVNVTPLVAENKVFILDARGGMWAFEAKTGVQRWKADLSCTGRQFQLATPAYHDGKLFIATNDGHVYALEAGSGNIIWDKIVAEQYDQLNTPVKYAEGKVYVGSWRNKTYFCLDASNGKILWQRVSTTGGGYYWSGACVVGNYLIFGDESAVLTCVYKDNGMLVDEKNLRQIIPEARKIRSSVTYNHQTNKVYFTDEGGHCWAFHFNSETGQLTYAWHKKIGRVSSSTPAVFKGKVYVGTGTYVFQGDLYCLEEETGRELWKFTPPMKSPQEAGARSRPGIESSPSLFLPDGKVYIYLLVNYEYATAYCLDENGNKLWEFTSQQAGTSGGYTTSNVAIADGWAYFGNDGGWVYALTEEKKLPGQVPGEEKVKLSLPVFPDLPAGHWASEILFGMTAKGILKGYPDGTCRPGQPVTRAEFVTLLLRTLGLEEDEGAAVDFNDVQPGDWYFRAIATAYHYGLVRGYAGEVEEGQGFRGQAARKQYFRPHDQVTREQVAAILGRALEFKKSGNGALNEIKVKEILARFNDQEEISSWAKEAVAKAVAREIIRGYPGNLFKPQAGATRAECAAMLMKIMN